MNKVAEPEFSYKFLLPKYWGIWLGFTIMFLISLLPYTVIHRIGLALTPILKKLLKRRHHIARKNLQICFPNMPEQEREEILEKNMQSTGLAAVETAMAWFWPDWRIEKNITYSGLEHIDQAREEGKGVLLIAIHALHLELGARAYGVKNPGVGVYRPNDNPLYDWIQFKGRIRSNKYMVDRKDIKGMLRALKSGDSVWYAPDHDYGRHRSVFVPLFAEDKACTTTGTHLLAGRSKCKLIPYVLVRLPNAQGYEMRIMPALEGYPTKDATAGAAFINRAVEKSIMQAPEQYMWMHRRFKHREDEHAPSVYE